MDGQFDALPAPAQSSCGTARSPSPRRGLAGWDGSDEARVDWGRLELARTDHATLNRARFPSQTKAQRHTLLAPIERTRST